MLETIQDRVAKKGVDMLERVLDGDTEVTPAQARAAMSTVGHEIKLRGTVNRDISNAITVMKMHPDKALRERATDALLARLLPEAGAGQLASGKVVAESPSALAGQTGQ
jgi:hypothetical protein